MNILRSLILIITFTFAFACTDANKGANNNSGMIELTGELQQAGMTTYQYGTHILTTDNKIYALKSSNIDLNKYNGKHVTVTGKKLEGYPVENGPELIEVTELKE
jgi:hypothetical protein